MPLTDHFSFIPNQNQQFTHNLWKRQLNVKRSICIASSFVPYFVIKNSTSCCVIYLNVRCNISMSILYKNVFFLCWERQKLKWDFFFLLSWDFLQAFWPLKRSFVFKQIYDNLLKTFIGLDVILVGIRHELFIEFMNSHIRHKLKYEIR